MKRFYQVSAFFFLLHLWAPLFTRQGLAQTGSVQVLDVRTAIEQGGKKLTITLTITNHDQLSELVLLFSNSPATTPLADGNNMVSYMPYHYLGEVFLAYSNKKVPFLGNTFTLEVDIHPEATATSFSLFALDRNRVPSAPVTHQYK